MADRKILSAPLARWAAIRQTREGFFALWRLITFVLVALGFLALACTGQISLLAVTLFSVFWLLGLALPHPPEWWREWMSRLVVWCALALIGMIALVAHFDSILYLLLFLSLYKCYTLREPADHMHAMVMAFFMFLACTVITAAVHYLVFMLLFVIFLMLELVFITIGREGRRALGSAFRAHATEPLLGAGGGEAASSPSGAVYGRLFLNSTLTGLLVLLLASLLFLILPHYSSYRFVNPWLRNEQQPSVAQSGYVDEITFGSLGRLELDDTEVMRVTPSWADGAARPLPSALRLRGLALDQYDETHWNRYSLAHEIDSPSWRVINFPDWPTFQGPVLRQAVFQRMAATHRLFGAVNPIQFRLRPGHRRHHAVTPEGGMLNGIQRNQMIRMDWWTRSLQIMTPHSAFHGSPYDTMNYEVDSRWCDDAAPLVRQLARHNATGLGRQPERSAEGTTGSAPGPAGQPAPAASPAVNPADLPDPSNPLDWRTFYQFNPELRLSPAEWTINTQLPPTHLTMRLTELARRQATAPDAPGKITQLLAWFHDSFEYSLTPETPRGMHPIDAFLTRTHKGHCEYFATAFVLLLRAQDIPARVATGFLSTEWHPTEQGKPGFFVVKQSDAHAWAEVWLDGYGWLTLDPTPSYWRGRAAAQTRHVTAWSRLAGRVRSAWRQYVLDYTNVQQARFITSLLNHHLLQRTSRAVQPFVMPFTALKHLRDGQIDLPTEQLLLDLLLLGCAALLALLLALEWRARRKRQRAAGTRSPVPFMNALLERLAECGWRRRAAQTPAELVRQVERETHGRWQLLWIIEFYHRCRYAAHPPTPEEQARINEAIRNLKLPSE